MTYTLTETSRRYPALKSLAAQAREIIVAGALPDSLRARLEVDLRDALRKGFHVDLDQLEVALAHASK